jgi:hypothetical protein
MIFISQNVCTPARAALRWLCGLGLGGMVGSALLASFIYFIPYRAIFSKPPIYFHLLDLSLMNPHKLMGKGRM